MRATILFTALFAFLLSADASQASPFRVFRPVPKKCIPSRATQYLGPKISLIQGDSLEGWTTISGTNPPPAWSVVDGVLHLKGKGGDIISDREYKNYILDFSWTISQGGNSGIKYRFKRFEGKGWLGPEYQVLDDYNTREGTKEKNNTATLYDIKPANSKKRLHPHTEKNFGRIVVNGNRIEHWLNGKKVLDIIVGSEEWKALLAESKFKSVEGFGENSEGRIMIQDHQCEVWFHEVSIREIQDVKSRPSRVQTRPCSRNYRSYQVLQKNVSCRKYSRPRTTYCHTSGYGLSCLKTRR